MREITRSERRVELRVLEYQLPTIDWNRLAEGTALFLLVSALWGCILLVALGGLH